MKYLYSEEIKSAPLAGKDNHIVFTGGGTGAGKSTAIKDINEMQNLTRDAQLIYDTNLSGFNSAVKKIDQATKEGKEVYLVGVYRDPVDSFVGGALPRAVRMKKEQGSGRTVPIHEHVNTHIGFKETFIKLAEKYKENQLVEIRIIDNSRGFKNSKEVSIDFLNKKSHNKGELKKEILTSLEEWYGRNKEHEDIYSGFKEAGKVKKAQDVYEAKSRHDSEGNGSQLKQEGSLDNYIFPSLVKSQQDKNISLLFSLWESKRDFLCSKE